MRRFFLLLVLPLMTSGQASHAQFNIRTDQADVSIGSDGINVRQGGQKVHINHNGINVNQPKHNSRVHTAVTTHVKTVKTIDSSATSVNVHGGGGKDIILDNSGFEGTVACNGGNVVLNASACKVRFTGSITALVLNGSSNNITCDQVHHVQVNGSANDVNWSRGCTPSVANAGSANTLKSR